MTRKSRDRRVYQDRSQAIMGCIGSDRMAPYREEAGGSNKGALELYRWNAELSAAFWSLISLTEVTLRNKLDEHLGLWCQIQGGHREWLLHMELAPRDLRDEFGGKARTFRSRAEDAKKIRDTGTGLITKPHRRRDAPLTNDDVLAQITLGEWVSFIPAAPRVLSDGTEEPIPDPTTFERRLRLWKAVVCGAFPGIEQPYKLASELYLLKLFRNRIAHHEPIFTVEYQRHRNELLRILGSVAPVVHEWYTSTDPLPRVFKKDPRRSQ